MDDGIGISGGVHCLSCTDCLVLASIYSRSFLGRNVFLLERERERVCVWLSGFAADIALSVAQYTSTQAEIHAAFPDDWVSTASAADASSVLVSLELSVHLVEQVDSDLMSDKLDWTGSPGWSLSYAVDEMPWAGVAVVQASLESEVCWLWWQ